MENSSFGSVENKPVISEIQPLENDGAISDTFKMCIDGVWYFQKRPKKEFVNHPHYISAFQKEFNIGSKLSHPNLIQYLGKGTDEKGMYIQTEFIDGWNLKEFIEKNPHYFKYREHTYRFIQQLLSALDYLHKNRILHLDLKPENIMITYIGLDVKLIDLGFAYSSGHLYHTSGRTTKYAAPEQLIPNNNSINQTADIYSFGKILLYIFTQSTQKKLIDKIPQPFREGAELCLKYNPFDRIQSIEKLRTFFNRKRLERKILTIFWITLPIAIIIFSFIASSSYSAIENNSPPVYIEEVKSSLSFLERIAEKFFVLIVVGLIASFIGFIMTRYKRRKNTIKR